MKFKCLSKNLEILVEVTNLPELILDEIEIAHPENTSSKILGSHRWNYLNTTSDLSLFFGQIFQMENDEWQIRDCVVCKDTTKIYYTHALKK